LPAVEILADAFAGRIRVRRADTMGKKSKSKKTPPGPVQVELTLSPETLENLDVYAQREGLSRHKAARQIIERFFDTA
jgi:hypothetical protein